MREATHRARCSSYYFYGACGSRDGCSRLSYETAYGTSQQYDKLARLQLHIQFRNPPQSWTLMADAAEASCSAFRKTGRS